MTLTEFLEYMPPLMFGGLVVFMLFGYPGAIHAASGTE